MGGQYVLINGDAKILQQLRRKRSRTTGQCWISNSQTFSSIPPTGVGGASAKMGPCKLWQQIQTAYTPRRQAMIKHFKMFPYMHWLWMLVWFANISSQDYPLPGDLFALLSHRHVQKLCRACCQDKRRFLTGEEMLASQVLPVTSLHASLCGAPKLQVENLPNNVKGRMAGNSMSTLCCGAMLMACILALEHKWIDCLTVKINSILASTFLFQCTWTSSLGHKIWKLDCWIGRLDCVMRVIRVNSDFTLDHPIIRTLWLQFWSDFSPALRECWRDPMPKRPGDDPDGSRKASKESHPWAEEVLRHVRNFDYWLKTCRS